MKSNIFESTLNSTHTFSIPESIALPFINTSKNQTKGIKRVKVKVTFEKKEVEFHAALQKRNTSYFVMFSKKLQNKVNVFSNDYFQVQLYEDTSNYGVEMPEEFNAVLQSDLDAFTLFESLTDGKKRSLIYYVLGFKNAQTRIDKALIITENLKLGIRDNQELIKKT